MAEKLDAVEKAQEAYRLSERRRKLQWRLQISLFLAFVASAILGGYYYVVSQEAGAKDCSNPRNANTPYCTERKSKTESNWRSVTNGEGPAFNLTPR